MKPENKIYNLWLKGEPITLEAIEADAAAESEQPDTPPQNMDAKTHAEIPHCDAAARIVTAMQDGEIASQFDAETLLRRASDFIAGLKSEAAQLRSLDVQ